MLGQRVVYPFSQGEAAGVAPGQGVTGTLQVTQSQFDDLSNRSLALLRGRGHQRPIPTNESLLKKIEGIGSVSDRRPRYDGAARCLRRFRCALGLAGRRRAAGLTPSRRLLGHRPYDLARYFGQNPLFDEQVVQIALQLTELGDDGLVECQVQRASGCRIGAKVLHGLVKGQSNRTCGDRIRLVVHLQMQQRPQARTQFELTGPQCRRRLGDDLHDANAVIDTLRIDQRKIIGQCSVFGQQRRQLGPPERLELAVDVSDEPSSDSFADPVDTLHGVEIALLCVVGGRVAGFCE